MHYRSHKVTPPKVNFTNKRLCEKCAVIKETSCCPYCGKPYCIGYEGCYDEHILNHLQVKGNVRIQCEDDCA